MSKPDELIALLKMVEGWGRDWEPAVKSTMDYIEHLENRERELSARVAELDGELANTRRVVFESAGFIPRPCTVESFHAEFERRMIEAKVRIEKEFGAKMEAYGRQIIDAFRLDEIKDEGNED